MCKIVAAVSNSKPFGLMLNCETCAVAQKLSSKQQHILQLITNNHDLSRALQLLLLMLPLLVTLLLTLQGTAGATAGH
jgi:hypothetical protein